jgi:periplasmic divalent cation tolerance protein
MADGTNYCIVVTTAGSEEQAHVIAEALVDRRLAACVNIVPKIQSVYRWKGKIAKGEELLLMIKTSRRLFPEVRAAIRELHSYELPEILLTPIDDADSGFLGWLEESLGPAEEVKT